jgi:hypothetical protein
MTMTRLFCVWAPTSSTPIHIVADMRRQLVRTVGDEQQRRYWELFEQRHGFARRTCTDRI